MLSSSRDKKRKTRVPGTVVGKGGGDEGPLCDPGSELLTGEGARE